MPTLIATKIVDEGDRKLIYGHYKWSDYHVIAKPEVEVSEGDIVEYDEEGWNFGWFKSVKKGLS